MRHLNTDDGVAVHYVVQGTGPLAIFYLHWMGGDAGGWAELWRELGSERFCHVAIDFRGHGRSSPQPCAFSNDRLARDVLHVAESLEVERFVVCGHSFGGKVGLWLTSLAPERVLGLILLGSVGPGQVALDRSAVEDVLLRAGDPAFLRETFQSWFKVWPRPELDRWIDGFARTPAWAHRAVCEIALWSDVTREVATLATPTLILAGEHDPLYGPAYQRDAVLPAVPHARVTSIDCGHGLPLERPEDIAAHMSGFLAELNP